MRGYSIQNQQIVKVLKDVEYGFDDKGPRYYTSHAGSYRTQHFVDPAPCYAHDVELVKKELQHLQAVAPLPDPLAIFLLSHEELGRTNAWCEDAMFWDDKEVQHHVSIITVNAKRIPPHPAMTRYLIAHEYGHAVNNWIVRFAKVKDEEFDQRYISDFRLKATTAYGCGKWHQNVGELIANDFRILVAKREKEYWPHEGFERPEKVKGLTKWWRQWQDILIHATNK